MFLPKKASLHQQFFGLVNSFFAIKHTPKRGIISKLIKQRLKHVTRNQQEIF